MTAKTKQKKREYIQLDNNQMLLLKKLLNIKQKKCYYCGEYIKKKDKFSIYNFPTRLVCNSILCVLEAIGEDEESLK